MLPIAVELSCAASGSASSERLASRRAAAEFVGRVSRVRRLDRLLSKPPVSRAMFDILQHDDRVDPGAFCKALGIELTPLDQTLADHVGPPREDLTQTTEEA